MDQRIQKLASWNPATQQINTQLTSRAKAQPNSSRPLQEKEGFEQDQFEVARLQLKEKIGGITSVEQQQLGVLQAKMNDSWLQRREKLSRFGHNLANIPISSPDKQGSKPVQPKLAIKKLAPQKLLGMASKKEMGSVKKAFRGMPAPQMLPMRTLQAKFTIGEPGDKYEQEADSVAAKVVNQIHSPQFQQQGQVVQRQEEREEELQTKPSNDVLQNSPLLPGIQLEETSEEQQKERFLKDYPLAAEMVENITKKDNNGHLVELKERFMNSGFIYDMTPTTPEDFLKGNKKNGDCSTLAKAYVKIAQEYFGHQDVKTSFKMGDFFVPGGGKVLDENGATGNVDKGNHWVFTSHYWVKTPRGTIDLLFLGQEVDQKNWVDKTGEGKIDGEEYRTFGERTVYQANYMASTLADKYSTDKRKAFTGRKQAEAEMEKRCGGRQKNCTIL